MRRLAISNCGASPLNIKVMVRFFSDVDRKKRRGVPFSAEVNADKINAADARFALSLSSWFCLPDEGMKDFEILCRSSAFIIEASETQLEQASFNYPPMTFQHWPRYHFLTVSHGLAPWRWPKQYQMEENGTHAWLRALTEENTIFTLEVRHEKTGLFSSQTDLSTSVYHHEAATSSGTRRDLAVLHLQVDDTRLLRKRPEASEKERQQDMAEQELAAVRRLQGLGVRVFKQAELVDLSQRTAEQLAEAVRPQQHHHPQQ